MNVQDNKNEVKPKVTDTTAKIEQVVKKTTKQVEPLNGILGVSITGNSLIEWSTIIAAIVYLCVAWGFVYLMDLIYPITPRDVEK